jgi:arylsulfatase A-like enzyme
MKSTIFKFTLISGVCIQPLTAQIKPNVVFILADEWRSQAMGYNGDPNVLTPHLDALARKSINFSNNIACCPVSGPYRASLLTGQYPLTNGFFLNDVQLSPDAVSMGKLFRDQGYNTAYIGKWHLDGNGRSSFIPHERRHGFEYWKVLECTHDYNNSFYWDTNDLKNKWEGYDAYAQTDDAIQYINNYKKDNKPFLLFLSWGPPHTPFHTAPENYKRFYHSKELILRDNVPEKFKQKAIEDLIGYYAHITALDSCVGRMQQVIAENGLERNTIFIFTSDHGHMIRSHATDQNSSPHKQLPYEESISVPLLIRFPLLHGDREVKNEILIGTPDILPTLLSMCKIPLPASVEGKDKSLFLLNPEKDKTNSVLIACYHAFGQWNSQLGGKEYRGVRTKRFTYARDLNGPWVLFDNQKDPFQLNNLINSTSHADILRELEFELSKLLQQTNDEFLPGMEYVKKWGYIVDPSGTAPYQKINYLGKPIIE